MGSWLVTDRIPKIRFSCVSGINRKMGLSQVEQLFSSFFAKLVYGIYWVHTPPEYGSRYMREVLKNFPKLFQYFGKVFDASHPLLMSGCRPIPMEQICCHIYLFKVCFTIFEKHILCSLEIIGFQKFNLSFSMVEWSKMLINILIKIRNLSNTKIYAYIYL